MEVDGVGMKQTEVWRAEMSEGERQELVVEGWRVGKQLATISNLEKKSL